MQTATTEKESNDNSPATVVETLTTAVPSELSVTTSMPPSTMSVSATSTSTSTSLSTQSPSGTASSTINVPVSSALVATSAGWFQEIVRAIKTKDMDVFELLIEGARISDHYHSSQEECKDRLAKIYALYFELAPLDHRGRIIETQIELFKAFIKQSTGAELVPSLFRQLEQELTAAVELSTRDFLIASIDLLMAREGELFSQGVHRVIDMGILKQSKKNAEVFFAKNPKGDNLLCEKFIANLNDIRLQDFLTGLLERLGRGKLQFTKPRFQSLVNVQEVLSEWQQNHKDVEARAVQLSDEKTGLAMVEKLAEDEHHEMTRQLASRLTLLREDKERTRPLPSWCLGPMEEIKPRLVAMKLDVNERDTQGNTLLHYAMSPQYRNSRMVFHLVKIGANKEVRNLDGQMPADLLPVEIKDAFLEIAHAQDGMRTETPFQEEVRKHCEKYAGDNALSSKGIWGFLRDQKVQAARDEQLATIFAAFLENRKSYTDALLRDTIRRFLFDNPVRNSKGKSRFLDELQTIYLRLQNSTVCRQIALLPDTLSEPAFNMGILPIERERLLREVEPRLAELAAEKEKLEREKADTERELSEKIREKEVLVADKRAVEEKLAEQSQLVARERDQFGAQFAEQRAQIAELSAQLQHLAAMFTSAMGAGAVTNTPEPGWEQGNTLRY